MLPIPFSISPLLLSVLVFYPWALALGVWQIGLHTSKSQRSLPAATRGASELNRWANEVVPSVDRQSVDVGGHVGVIEPEPEPPVMLGASVGETESDDPLTPHDDVALPARAPPSKF